MGSMRELHTAVLQHSGSILATTIAALLILGVFKVARWRMYIRSLRAQGLPMPPHNLLFGHIPLFLRILNYLPNDAHKLYITTEITRLYPEIGPDFYLDLYPFSMSIFAIGSPELAQQSRQVALPRMPNLKEFFRPICDGKDMINMDYPDWKRWRGIFNPGFSQAHLMTWIPQIVKEVETFCKVLDKHAEQQDVFRMKPATDCLTLDIIGQGVLGVHFDCQRVKNTFVESFRTQSRWLTFAFESDGLDYYNPLRPVVHFFHKRIVNKYIAEQFTERVEAHKTQADLKQTKSVVDLAINACSPEHNSKGETTLSQFDPKLADICMAQLKLFLFSGHDTTSSSVCYHLYLLSQHPEALAKLRAEHDTIFGPDLSLTASKISASPTLINQLPYTTAYIKESLRLYPTVTPSRSGQTNVTLTDEQRRSFPTGPFLLLPNTQAIHHNPRFWPRSTEFIPERFLVGPEDPLYPVKYAWRGFEHGLRNCIGQELAMIEMKLVLVMVARAFAFKPVYEEVYGGKGRKLDNVNGEKAYQTGALQPRGDLPLRVERRGLKV